MALDHLGYLFGHRTTNARLTPLVGESKVRSLLSKPLGSPLPVDGPFAPVSEGKEQHAPQHGFLAVVVSQVVAPPPGRVLREPPRLPIA